MMSEKYQTLLESICRKFAKGRKDIFDIILYGSFARGKTRPKDIDIAIIFFGKGLKEAVEESQELKESIKKELEMENFDVKQMNMANFFDENFLARQGVILEGISLLDGFPLSKKFGFECFAMFRYNLKNLDRNGKTKFEYALNGRKSRGILKSLSGEYAGRGAVLIPIKNSHSFEEFLKRWHIEHEVRYLLTPFY